MVGTLEALVDEGEALGDEGVALAKKMERDRVEVKLYEVSRALPVEGIFGYS